MSFSANGLVLCPRPCLAQVISLIDQFVGLDELYQKGCQEKSSASTGVEKFSRDPAHDD